LKKKLQILEASPKRIYNTRKENRERKCLGRIPETEKKEKLDPFFLSPQQDKRYLMKYGRYSVPAGNNTGAKNSMGNQSIKFREQLLRPTPAVGRTSAAQ
jgi:hypothetical protein